MNRINIRDRDLFPQLWARVRALFSGLDTRVSALERGGGGGGGGSGGEGNTIESISLNGVNIPPDASKNVNIVALTAETDPTVPAWAKQSSKPAYTAAEVGAIPSAQKGSAGGVAELDENGLVLSAQLPSYVDDVLEYASTAAFPSTGEAGKIYVDTTTNLTYRWTGSGYVEISPSLALGETSATAYRGDRGKAAYDHAQARGSAFASGLYKITTNAEGHVTGATAVSKADLTALGLPAQDTTYAEATQTASGLMSAADKAKLDGVETGAQVNTVTGVKGHAESEYRTGNVDITANNVGAIPTSGGNYTGRLWALRSDVNPILSDNGVEEATYLPVIGAVGSGVNGLFYVDAVAYPTGAIGFLLDVMKRFQGTRHDTKIEIQIDNDGNVTYEFSHPDEIKEALGIEDNDHLGFYIDAQGYLCQRIGSDT